MKVSPAGLVGAVVGAGVLGASVGAGAVSVCSLVWGREYALVQELTTGSSVGVGSILASAALGLWTALSMLKLP